MVNRHHNVAAVIIGRNEGERLVRCLNTLINYTDKIVYVDSASTDSSIEEAQKKGAHVIALDMSMPFTAARARNAGFEKALTLFENSEFIQFIDGDCEMLEGWLDESVKFLQSHPQVAVVSGVLKERFPHKSIFNTLCDNEWSMPIGSVKSCGGNALMRVKAFKEVGGFLNTLIAGEEPELCVRLRQKGWLIWHIDNNMMLHDANMMHISQWWKRCKRSGYAFAEGSYLHGGAPEYHWVAESRRSLIWGALLPVIILVLSFISWKLSFILLFIYPLQIIRLAFKTKQASNWLIAVHLVMSKFPEAVGQMEFYKRRILKLKINLIEHK